MPRKPKETVSIAKEQKNILKNKVIAVVLGILSLVTAAVAIREIQSKVEKNKINDYVCEVVNIDTEVGILAMRCMAKESEK